MDEIESLYEWDAHVGQLAEMRERLRRRPQYPAAAQRLAANLLRDSAEDPLLDAMLRDAGHNVYAAGAIYLHACGEVTLARLKTFVAGFGLVSPGRARSLLNYMLHLGYLEPDPAASAPRRASYRVAPRFLASYRRHSASVLDALSVVEPAVGLIQKHLSAPGVFEALVTEQCDTFISGSSQPRPFAAVFRVFLHRLAGIQILHSLVAQATAFPPAGNIPFSISGAARRFKVSRAHVVRILKDANAEGFVALEPGVLRFTEAGLEVLDWFYTGRLCLNLACAARVVKANPQLRPPPAA